MPGYTQSMSWLKDLSHTGRRLLSQPLTAMCLSRMTRECISVGLSATRKVSDADAAGTLEADAGKQLNAWLASGGLLRQ